VVDLNHQLNKHKGEDEMAQSPKVKRPLAQKRLLIEDIQTPLDHKMGDYDFVSYTLDGVGNTFSTKAFCSYEKILRLLEKRLDVNPLNQSFNKVNIFDGSVCFRGAIVGDSVCFKGITATTSSFSKDSTHGYFVTFEVFCDNIKVYSKGWSYSNCGDEIDLTLGTFDEINDLLFA